MCLCQTELFEIQLFIWIKMDLALNNLQCLICHKTKPNQTRPGIESRSLIALFNTLPTSQWTGMIYIYISDGSTKTFDVRCFIYIYIYIYTYQGGHLWKIRNLAAGMGVGVGSMPTGSGGLILQDPKPPVNPKETSLMTHPNASMKMYDIRIYIYIYIYIYTHQVLSKRSKSHPNIRFVVYLLPLYGHLVHRN